MQRYSTTAIVLHWLIALLIVGTFTLGLVMTNIPGLTPAKLHYYSWHKWAGVTVLALAALRLLWRLATGAPAYPATMPAWQRRAAHGLHALLYLLLFAVPLSGYFYTLAAGVPVAGYGPRGSDQAIANIRAAVIPGVPAVLLANHGPVVSGTTLEAAVYATEELEETAKLFLLLQGREAAPLDAEAVQELVRVFGLEM